MTGTVTSPLNYIHPGDMVILGNRYETQLCAIEMGASCVIITMGAKISKTIQIFAHHKTSNIFGNRYSFFLIHLVNNGRRAAKRLISEINRCNRC